MGQGDRMTTPGDGGAHRDPATTSDGASPAAVTVSGSDTAGPDAAPARLRDDSIDPVDAVEGAQPEGPGDDRTTAATGGRFARVPRWLRISVVVLLVLSVAGYAGYRYLLTTEYGVFFTLFADDRRADNFRAMDDIFPARDVAATGAVWQFAEEPRPLPETYGFEGEQRELEGFLDRTETTGLLVLDGETVVHERYEQGYDADARITSWSVAKSFVATLVGIADAQGDIDSIDDEVVDYVPALVGSGYDGATIRDLLTMSSGVAFDEGYDSTFADVNMIFLRAFAFGEPMLDYYAALERERTPGTYNEYISSDTGVLAAVLSAATGSSVSDLLERWIWEPVGMERDAFWSLDRSGEEIGFCCLNASLRDYGRFGLLYARDGVRDGQRILPEGFVRAATTPEAPRLEPGDNPDSFWTFGYGYQWWIPEQPRAGEFVAIGVWGQYVYVDAERDVVIVRTATDPGFDDHDHEAIEVFRAISDELRS